MSFDALHHDHGANTGAERTSASSGQGAGAAAAVEQHAVAGDPGVEDAEPAVCRKAPQTVGEPVGPAVVGVGRRAGAVGDGVPSATTLPAVAASSTSTPVT